MSTLKGASTKKEGEKAHSPEETKPDGVVAHSSKQIGIFDTEHIFVKL